MPVQTWLTPQNVSTALQANPQIRTEITDMLAQTGDNRTPEDWLLADLQAGDTNSSFINAVQVAANAPVATAPTTPVAGGTTATPAGSGINFNVLTNAGTQPPLTIGSPVSPPAGSGDQGYSQNQTGSQTGGYTSVGGSTSTQNGGQSTTTTGMQDTTGTQTGTTSGTGTQTSTQAGTSTTGVNAPFDVNALVNKQLGSADVTDTARNAWLTDFMQNGGSGFNSQVDQAVRQSLSGPQMTGAGDSARARAAGYAGAQVARNNAGERLSAAGQLTNPGAATNSTVSAFTPLFGTTKADTNTGNTASTSDQTNNQSSTGSATSSGASNQLSFQNLVSNEGQAGTATGASAQQGFGVTPKGQTQKAGGCVVCTAYVARGEMKPGAVRRACKFKQANWHRYGTSLAGYLLVGPLLARAVLVSDVFARTLKPVARAILYEEVRLSAPTRVGFKWNAYIQHGVFDLLFYPVGLGMKLAGMKQGLRDTTIINMLQREKLLFKL